MADKVYWCQVGLAGQWPGLVAGLLSGDRGGGLLTG